MIERLRKRFIRIATLAVAGVLLLLCVTVNAANYVSVNRQLTQMLQMICDNQGTVPHFPPDGKPGQKPDGPFTPETPYSTRYFVLRYDGDGDLEQADLTHIAAVSEDDTAQYLTAALRHGAGFGYTAGYKYYVVHTDTDRWMAIFLDSYQELHAVVTFAWMSLAAAAVCVALVYGIIVLCSRRAIAPVIQASERQKQFITDASHELKTPITVIATSLKVLEMEVGQQKWIDKAEAQTEKLTELVNELVTLSRMDEEASPLQMAGFQVSDALAETAESFRDFAASAGHTLDVRVTPGLTYCGDEYAIRQLVSILLDNAVKYAAPGTPIVFSLAKGRHGVVIRTENQCDVLDTAAVARQTASLEAKGYLRREANPADGRNRCLYATAQAERLKSSKAAVETQFYGWLLDPLTEPERAEFARMLDVLYRRCKAESKAGFPNVAASVKEGTTNGE